MGQYFGSELYETEVQYLFENKWAIDIEDIIWRRTKLNLRLADTEKTNSTSFLESYYQPKNLNNSVFELVGSK